jgi:phosphatidylglycerophosphatase A
VSATELPRAEGAGGVVSFLATGLATGLGAGYSPVAPGTAGSAVGVLLFWPLAGRPAAEQAVAVAVLFLVGAAAATRVARRAGRKDPGLVVVDEVVGVWTTLAFLPLTWTTAVAGFLVFRLMDILKPYPARDLERLPGGWGIMADDLMAGVYANLLLRVGLLVWPAA